METSRGDASGLGQRVREILDGGGGEAVNDGSRFVPLVTLDSGARVGLDAEARWLLAPETGAPVPFSPTTAHLFHEVLEQKRRRFDDALEEAARAAGLPAEAALFSFPAVDVVRAVLAKEHPYLTRLALEWIGPTELRLLRAEIQSVTRAQGMPVPVRELAERLIVPE
jgi:hypothetical protein